MASESIPFKPADADVVSTKLRTWNKSHPGNVVYTDIIAKQAIALVKASAPEIRRAAESVVDTIHAEHGGRFLKIPDGEQEPDTCSIMERAACVNKAVNAIKQAVYRLKVDSGEISSPKATSKPRSPKNISSTNNLSGSISNHNHNSNSNTRGSAPKPTPKSKSGSSALATSTPRSHSYEDKSPGAGFKRKLLDTDFIEEYEIQKGELISIDDCAVDIILFVCNHKDPTQAVKELYEPNVKYRSVTNPRKEEHIRSQIRQRLIAARAVDVDPIEFCKRLLSFWGAGLALVKKPKFDENVEDQPPTSRIDFNGIPGTPNTAQCEENDTSMLDQNSINLEDHTEPFIDPFIQEPNHLHLLQSPVQQDHEVRIHHDDFFTSVSNSSSNGPMQQMMMGQNHSQQQYHQFQSQNQTQQQIHQQQQIPNGKQNALVNLPLAYQAPASYNSSEQRNTFM